MADQDSNGWTVVRADGSQASPPAAPSRPAPGEATGDGWTIRRAGTQSIPPPALALAPASKAAPVTTSAVDENGEPDELRGIDEVTAPPQNIPPTRYDRDEHGALVSKWDGSRWVDLYTGKSTKPPAKEEGGMEGIPGMERLGGTPPGVPAPALPAGLQKHDLGGPVDTGLEMPYKGLVQALTGAKQLAHAGSQGTLIAAGTGYYQPQVPLPTAARKEAAAGLTNVLGGGMEIASPLLLPAAVAAPAATVGTLIASTAAGAGTEKGLEAAGVAPEYAGLAGTVASMLVGGEGARRIGAKIYEAAGSPEVKIGGTFEEPKPFSQMSDEELIGHANSIEQNPPKNYNWQREQIVQEAAKRQAERGMPAGTQPPNPAQQFQDEDFGPHGRGAPPTEADAGEPVEGGWQIVRAGADHQTQSSDTGATAPETMSEPTSEAYHMPAPTAPVPEPAGDGWTIHRAGDNIAANGPAAAQAENSAGGEERALSEPNAPVPAARKSSPATTVLVPGESTEYPASYEIADLNSLRASHHPYSFQEDPTYAYTNDRDYTKQENQNRVISQATAFNPRYLITDNPDATNGPPVVDPLGNTIGGNSRVMTMQRVYPDNPEGVAAYKDLLRAKAEQFGLDPAEVDRFRQPVLVRRIGDNDATGIQRAITDLNKVGTAALSPGERALVDSRRVSPDTLDFIGSRLDSLGEDASMAKLLASDAAPEIVQRMIADGIITDRDRPQFLNEADSKITPEGKQRVMRLMVGRFFPDSATFDNTPALIKAKLERMVAPMSHIEQRRDWDVMSQHIRDGLELAEEARQHGLAKYEDLDAQDAMWGKRHYSPGAYLWANILKNNSAAALGKAFSKYAELESLSRPGETVGMFAGEPVPQGEAFLSAFGNLRTVKGGKKIGAADEGGPAPVAARLPNESLFNNEEEEGSRQADQGHKDRLLGDQLTAQLKSGLAKGPSQLKPLENRGLFDEEGPEQGSLFARKALKTSPEMFGRVSEVSPGGNGYWVDAGKVHPVGTQLHAQYMETAKPGTLFHDIVQAKLREGAIRVRGENVEMHQAGLNSRNFEPAIEQAVKEADRKHAREIAVEVHTPSGTQFARVPMRDVPEFMHSPARYMRQANEFDMMAARSTPEESLSSLRAQLLSEHPGLTLDASIDHGGKYLSVNKIALPKDERGTGVGTGVMRAVLSVADAHGLTVTLTPTSEFGTSKSALEKWYGSLGFVRNAGRNKDFATRDTMIRPPAPSSLHARTRYSNPDQFSLFDERATTIDKLAEAKPHDPKTTFQVDPAKLPRVPDSNANFQNRNLPTIEEYNRYWHSSLARSGNLGGRAAVFVNGAAMNAILSRRSQFAGNESDVNIIGVTLSPGEWRNILQEARSAEAAPHQSAFDDALIQVASQIRKALSIPEGTLEALPKRDETAGAWTHPADVVRDFKAIRAKGPLIVVQTGRSIPDHVMQWVAEEEFDHAAQMQLPGGLDALPAHIAETPNGQIAAASLAKSGYGKLNPNSPFYHYDRVRIVAEIGVRLMRPGRWQELGLTAQQARDLAADYIKGLAVHGKAAGGIVDQIYESVAKGETALPSRPGSVEEKHQSGAPGAGGVGRRGPPELHGQDIPGDKPNGLFARNPEEVNPQTALTRYNPPQLPQLPASAIQAYAKGKSFLWHAGRVAMTPIELGSQFAQRADAYVLSLSAMELLGRAGGYAQDETGLKTAGLHISPRFAPQIANRLALMLKASVADDSDLARFLQAAHLYDALRRAGKAAKSLVVIGDHRWGQAKQLAAIQEELGHSLQAALTGDATATHEGAQIAQFSGHPIFQKAEAELLPRYKGITAAGMRAEVGVRLMYQNGHKDMKLSLPEARSLAVNYVRSLRQEHGSKPVREIAEAVFDALREPTQGGAPESGGRPGSVRPAGGSGIESRAGPDLPSRAASENGPSVHHQADAGGIRGPVGREANPHGPSPGYLASRSSEEPRESLPEPALFEEIAQNRAKADAQRNNALRDLKSRQAELTDKGFGERLRTYVTGTRDIEVAGTNQLRDQLRKALPAGIDQEALTLMRDFRRRPGELQQFLDGAHPYYKQIEAEGDGSLERLEGALERVQSVRPVIERALNPSPQMEAADRVLTQYFTTHLDEGKQLGFIQSNVGNDEYITHLLQPRTASDEAAKRMARGPRLGPRRFKFSKQRAYPTVIHAIANGIKPRTLNALDALAIYGERFGSTKAVRLLIDQLKKAGLGTWGTSSQQRGEMATVPREWTEMAPESRMFRNEVPFNDDKGNAQVMHQMFFVPSEVNEALRPIYEQSYLNRVPGSMTAKTYQAYLKSVELGMSIFHIRALNMMGLSSMNPQGLAEALRSDMESEDFLEAEREWIRDGLLTPILGRTWEAYKALQPTAVPTRLDLVRQWPLVRQADRLAGAITEYTFGTLQRKLKVANASMLEASWMAKHPQATAMQRAEARRGIAKYINAVYGGLNWENMGVSRTALDISRMLLLAPDWTFSNMANAKYAIFGTSRVPEDIGHGGAGEDRDPGGKAARLFWLKAASWALGLSAATTLMLAALHKRDGAEAMKEWLEDPTQVYMGKDAEGRKIRSNWWFTGAPGDAATAIRNAVRYGAVGGLGRSLYNKVGPLTRTAIEEGAGINEFGQPLIPPRVNTNLIGQPVGPPGPRGGQASRPPTWPEKTALGVEQAAKNLAPAPLSISTFTKMLLDKKHEYSPEEYASTILTSRAPTHEEPPKEKGATIRVHRALPMPITPPAHQRHP